jgi:cation diffusion facilitator family transporter
MNSIHNHNFNTVKLESEKKTKIVVIFTLITMVFEIAAGWYFGSMALFADGWHMSTHAAALSISLFAYILARKYSQDKKFNFGTWKIEILGAYTSAIILLVVAILLFYISIERIFNPVLISYNYALIVAVTGLIVNFVCALILNGGHHHPHEKHEHDHKDLNLQSAYIHVIADALTSVLAIIALLGAKMFGWVWLDPAIGILGAMLITKWAYSLIKDTASILVGSEENEDLSKKIKDKIECNNKTQICDLHVWRVSQDKHAGVITIAAKNPKSSEEYRSVVQSACPSLVHLSIEVDKLTRRKL